MSSVSNAHSVDLKVKSIKTTSKELQALTGVFLFTKQLTLLYDRGAKILFKISFTEV